MSNIPNTFQHPNDFIDALMPLLDDMENICLSFACRKILGWSEHRATLRDHISVTQFESGTGRSRGRIIKALNSLNELNVLVNVGDSPKMGREYELNLGQLGEIKMDELKARYDESHQAGIKRTQKARHTKEAVSQTNHPERSVPLTTSGQSDRPEVVSQTDTQNPLSKPTIKTQKSTRKKRASMSDENTPETLTPKGSVPEEKTLTPQQQMVHDLAAVMGLDDKLNGARLARFASELLKQKYEPCQVISIYGAGGIYWREDWRGKKGESPGEAAIRQTIAKLSNTNGANHATSNAVPKSIHAQPNPTIKRFDKVLI